MKIKIILLLLFSTILLNSCTFEPKSIRDSKRRASNMQKEALLNDSVTLNDFAVPSRSGVGRNKQFNDVNQVPQSYNSAINNSNIKLVANNHKFECPGFAKFFLESLKEQAEKGMPETAKKGVEWKNFFSLEYCPKALASFIDNQCINMTHQLTIGEGKLTPNWAVLDSLFSGYQVYQQNLFK